MINAVVTHVNQTAADRAQPTAMDLDAPASGLRRPRLSSAARLEDDILATAADEGSTAGPAAASDSPPGGLSLSGLLSGSGIPENAAVPAPEGEGANERSPGSPRLFPPDASDAAAVAAGAAVASPPPRAAAGPEPFRRLSRAGSKSPEAAGPAPASPRGRSSAALCLPPVRHASSRASARSASDEGGDVGDAAAGALATLAGAGDGIGSSQGPSLSPATATAVAAPGARGSALGDADCSSRTSRGPLPSLATAGDSPPRASLARPASRNELEEDILASAAMPATAIAAEAPGSAESRASRGHADGLVSGGTRVLCTADGRCSPARRSFWSRRTTHDTGALGCGSGWAACGAPRLDAHIQWREPRPRAGGAGGRARGPAPAGGDGGLRSGSGHCGGAQVCDDRGGPSYAVGLGGGWAQLPWQRLGEARACELAHGAAWEWRRVREAARGGQGSREQQPDER